MNKNEIINHLKRNTNEVRIKVNNRLGNTLEQYGVPMGVLRKLAKELGTNQELAISLWDTNNLDAMMLAVMIMDPNQMSKSEITQIGKKINFCNLMDEFVDCVISEHKDRIYFMNKWSKSKNDILGRGGWHLIVLALLKKDASDNLLVSTLKTIENEMKDTTPKKQETMNRALCEIGINYPKYTNECIRIGEKLGVYKDMKVSKGCTSPYALEWIRVGLAKNGSIKK